MKKITVRGITYPSLASACAAEQVAYSRIQHHMKHMFNPSQSDIDELFDWVRQGINKVRLTPITVAGKHYPSVGDACRAYCLSTSEVTRHLVRLKDPTQQQIDDVFFNAEPVDTAILVYGVLYPSVNQAAKAFGIQPRTATSRLEKLHKQVPEPSQAMIDTCFKPSVTDNHHNAKPLVVHGRKFDSITDAARYYGRDVRKVLGRLYAMENPTQEEIDDIFVNFRKKRQIHVTFQGKTFASLLEATRHVGVDYYKAKRRYQQLKNPTPSDIERLLLSLTSHCERRSHLYVHVLGKEYPSISSACRQLGVPYERVQRAMKKLREPSQKQIDDLFERAKKPYSKAIEIIYKGIRYKSIRAACADNGFVYSTIKHRMEKLAMHTENPTQEQIESCFY